MAELHAALKALGAEDWTAVPTAEGELDPYLTNLFVQCQTVLDSIPIPPPDEVDTSSRVSTHSSATKASEVSPSHERSAPPSSEHEKLQKEWGKAMKLKQSENPLSMHVYKLSGKDGKGAWFARRSVHEGIGFNRFKKSLEAEFPESMSEPGPPGTGNIRGIGGEEKVEDIKVHKKGCVEVYRLSAQFPGPTTPRDFVTLLVTSSNALNEASYKSDGGVSPRHYMILSKPCNHPSTQPRDGFIRGFYESVEFIREVPRKLKTSQSSMDLNKMGHGGKHDHGLEKDMLKHNTEKKSHTFHPTSDKESDHRPLSAHGESPSGRQRATTVGTPDEGSRQAHDGETYDPESNPVEWIMVTRSDPGGSVPRFMVERGTPGSICADAVKFLDWACQRDFGEGEEDETQDPSTTGGDGAVERKPSEKRRESLQSWRARSTVGIEEFSKTTQEDSPTELTASQPATAAGTSSGGLWGTVTGAAATLRPYAPQAVLDHLPNAAGDHAAVMHTTQTATATQERASPQDADEAHSIKSTTSFASAEDHLSPISSSDEEGAEQASLNSTGSPPKKTGQSNKEKDPFAHHEKEILRLAERREALQRKFASLNAKLNEAKTKQVSKDESAMQKATEKHNRELKKQEEKYNKEIEKIERKQEHERQKMAHKKRKQEDKDVAHKLTRERDEARQELELVNREAQSLRNLVQELQKENTALVMKLGRLGVETDSISKDGIASSSQSALSDKTLSRTATGAETPTSGGGNKKNKDPTVSAGASLKSNQS